MITDMYGQQIYSEEELCSHYLANTELVLKKVLVDKPIVFDDLLNLENVPEIVVYNQDKTLTIAEFDQQCQANLYLPNSYKQFDIAKFILDQCQGDDELQRAGEELLMYQERDLFDLLLYLKYLVDTMRANNIVWGVGRGSSVASFVLFLLGIHRINSLYYDLSITEFLK